MSSVLYLGEQDFYVGKGNRGNVICCNQPGVVFVMFHADPKVCQFCDLAKPEFMQIGQVIASAKFALCNLSRCKGLVTQSFQTITPLDKVPLFILFVNGRPFMNYNGEKQLNAFAEFMQQALQRLQQATIQTNNGGTNVASFGSDNPVKTAHGIEYDYDYITVTNSSMIGQVTCTDEGVCYLTAKESYGPMNADKTGNNPHSQQQPQQQRQPQPQQAYRPPPQMAQPQMAQMQPQMGQQMYYPQQQFQQQQYPAYQPVQQPYYPMQQPTRPLMTQPQQQYYAPQPQQIAYQPPQQQQYYPGYR